jgi:hypothetical protein
LDTAGQARTTIEGYKTLGGSMELATTINCGATKSAISNQKSEIP